MARSVTREVVTGGLPTLGRTTPDQGGPRPMSSFATVECTTRLPFTVGFIVWRDARGRHLWLNEAWQEQCLRAALAKGGIDVEAVLDRVA